MPRIPNRALAALVGAVAVVATSTLFAADGATQPLTPASVLDRIEAIKKQLLTGDFQEAAQLARALMHETANVGLPDKSRSEILQLTGRAEYELGGYDVALRLDEEALRLAQAAIGSTSQEVASIKDDLGVCLRHLGRLDDAETMFSASQKIFSAMELPDQRLFSELLINYAILAYVRGDLERAERMTFDALKRRRGLTPPEPALVAQALDNYGTILQEEGRLAAAKGPLQEGLDLRKKALRPRHPDIAASLNNLGVLEQRRGELSAAEQHLREAMGIDMDTYGAGDPQVLADLSNLGEVLRSMDRPDEALKIENEVLAGRKAQAEKLGSHADSLYDLAVSYGNVANILGDLKRYDEAKPLYEKALKIDIEIAGEKASAGVALDFNNIGEGLFDSGYILDAKAAFEKGLALVARQGDKGLRLQATLLHNFGVLLAGEADFPNAELKLRNATAIRTKVLPDDHIDLAVSRAWLAEVLSRAGRPGAVAEAQAALSILKVRSARSGVGLSASAAAAEARSSRAVAENILAVFARSGDQKDGFLASGVIDDALAALQIVQESGTAVVAARAAAQSLIEEPQGAATLRQIEDLRDRLDAAAVQEALVAAGSNQGTAHAEASPSAELEAQLTRLLSDLPDRVRDLTAPPRLQFADIKPKLAVDEGWLGFVAGDASTIVVLVTRDGVQLKIVAEGRERLAKRVGELRQALDPRTTHRFDLEASHLLYGLLFNDFGESFTRIKRLVVASDGALESLPLGVLVTAVGQPSGDEEMSYRQASWLSDQAVITVTPSFANAYSSGRIPSSTSTNASFVGFGDPALGPVQQTDASAQLLAKLMFVQGAPGAVEDVRSLPSLPETKIQLEAMNGLFASGQGELITGQAATKSAVEKANLASVRVIAFATHGLLAAENPTGEPALVMTPTPGLDDGMLTATDIANLKLDANLIVLSACNTAAPRLEYGADGLSGLARAFFHSGARAILISHWPVDTRATTSLMKLLASSKAKSMAGTFNAAARALRNQSGFAHPAFWAPFDLVGRGDDPLVGG